MIKCGLNLFVMIKLDLPLKHRAGPTRQLLRQFDTVFRLNIVTLPLNIVSKLHLFSKRQTIYIGCRVIEALIVNTLSRCRNIKHCRTLTENMTKILTVGHHFNAIMYPGSEWPLDPAGGLWSSQDVPAAALTTGQVSSPFLQQPTPLDRWADPSAAGLTNVGHRNENWVCRTISVHIDIV